MAQKYHPALLFILLGFSAVLAAQPKPKNRPQTPRPPFSYNSDSVEYDNEDKTVRLAGTFSYPKTKGPFITAVLITGSGQQDRDETIFDHRPFAIIADYLTQRGYAVLRVDDRGMGRSHGSLMDVTSLDFTDDVLTSIRYLLTREEVNKNRIGVIGHSEGGFIAPIVYAKWPRLSFIISLAGTGVSGAEILLRQQTDPLKPLVDSSAFTAFYELTQKTLAIIHDNPMLGDSAILAQVRDLYSGWKNRQTDPVLSALHADQASPEAYSAQVKQELIPWLRYFIATDPADFWRKVKCPVLALNGDKDIQVYADQNIQAIRQALKFAKNKRVTTRILPGLNHLFQSCTTCRIEEYAKLEESFSPAVLEIMVNWMHKTLK